MTAWDWATAAFFASLALCLWVAMRGSALGRFVGLQAAGVVVVLLLVARGQARHERSLLDLALVLATLSFGGGIVFVRFLERWL